MSTQPQRLLNNYTLSIDVSGDAGPLPIPIEQFERIIPATASATVFVDLGMTFAYDDFYDGRAHTTYKHAVVSPNGYIVLPDLVSNTTRDPSTIISRVITDEHTSSTIDSERQQYYDLVVCPWFCTQVVQYHDISSTTPTDAWFTVASTTRYAVTHGIDTIPNFVDERNGGVWIKRGHSSVDGIVTIIRWHTAAYEYRTDATLTPDCTIPPLFYECALYENGKIEFRYAKQNGSRSRRGTGLAKTAVIERYAACGVFPSDVPNIDGRRVGPQWRDFSVLNPTYAQPATRKLSQYGGAVYDSTFSDDNGTDTASYVMTMLASEHWFGQDQSNATITFAPPVNRSKFLPRNVIRTLDGMPAGSEHGDFHAYDDRLTTCYVDCAVNFPSRLQRFSYGNTSTTARVQGLFAQDFLVSASIVKGISDGLRDYVGHVSTTAPYSEDKQHTLNNVGAFYATGSAYKFGSALRDKTRIDIALPIDTRTTLFDVSGSVTYYDSTCNSFKTVMPSDIRDSLPTPTTFEEELYWGWYGSSPGHSFRMFSPFGTPVTSGSKITGVTQGSTTEALTFNTLLSTPSFEALNNALQSPYNGDVLFSYLYSPTLAQTFTPPIDKPFLVEKIIVNLPIEAGPGWFNDRTSTKRVDGTSYDVGGPAVTVGLLHDVTTPGWLLPSIRYLIASGVFTHANDMSSSFDSMLVKTISLTDVHALCRSGFPQYGTPAAIVGSLGTTTFTGSVTLEMEAGASSGILVYSSFSVSNPPTTDELRNIFCTPTIDTTAVGGWSSTIQHINPLQKNNGGILTSGEGRSIRGGQYASPHPLSGSTLIAANPFYVADRLSDVPTYLTATFNNDTGAGGGPFAVLNLNGVSVSPYLIMPGDKLVLTVSKTRPVISSSYSGGTPTFDYATHHDFKVGVGAVQVSLYGSYVRNDAECHDVNQRVNDSNAVHCSVIGGGPVLDEFDVNVRYTYTNTYTDDYVTGSLVINRSLANKSQFTNLKLVTGSRGRVFSKTTARRNDAPFDDNVRLSSRMRSSAEFAGFTNVLRLASDTERIYDTLMPEVAGVARAENAGILQYGPSGFVSYVTTLTESVFPTSLLYLKQWPVGFPFSSTYGNIMRVQAIQKSFIANYAVVGGTDVVVAQPVPKSSMTIFYRTGYRNVDFALLYDTVASGSSLLPPTVDDFVRMFYGIGDYRTMSESYGVISGHNNQPDCRVKRSGDVSVQCSVINRGWKYGVFNGFPTYSSAVWRVNRFGQIRDMLEQRIDTKFFDENAGTMHVLQGPVKVRFVDKNGADTSPENTWSSNLSVEATSSLPYFDNDVKNRAPIIVNAMNQTTIGVKQTQFGNILVS